MTNTLHVSGEIPCIFSYLSVKYRNVSFYQYRATLITLCVYVSTPSFLKCHMSSDPREGTQASTLITLVSAPIGIPAPS